MKPAGQRGAASTYPWTLVGLLWMVSFVNSADRSIFNAVKPLIRDAFNITDVQLGMVDTTFFWIYAAGAFFFGRLGDSVKRQNLIMFGLLFWSFATGMMPLATGFAMLLAARSMVAVGESTYYPSATALISRWHPGGTRSRALSIHQTAVFAGGGAGGWLAGRLADLWGWPVPFVAFAVMGFGIAGILLFGLRRDEDEAEPVRRVAQSVQREPIRVVFSNPGALVICAAYFLATSASSAVLNWSNTYAHDVLKLNLANSALVSSTAITMAGFLAVLVGGWLADRIASVRIGGRFLVLILGLGLAGLCLFPFFLVRSAAFVGLLLFATSFGKGLFDGCVYAAMHDVMPDYSRATAVGFMTFIGFLGAGISTIALPAIATQTGLATAFSMMAGLYGLAAVVLIAALPVVKRTILQRMNELAHA